MVKGAEGGLRFDSLRWRFSPATLGKRFREEERLPAQCAVSQNINLWDELELASELAKHWWLMEEKHWGSIQQMPSRGGKKWSKAAPQIRKLSWSDGKRCFLIMELILNAAANWTGWCRGTCLQQTEGKLPPDSCQVCVCWHVKEPSVQIWLVLCEGETTEKRNCSGETHRAHLPQSSWA